MNSTDIIHLQHLLQAVSIVNRRDEGQRRQKYCASIDRLKNVTFDSHQFNIDSFMQHQQSKSILSSCDCHDNKYEIKLTEYFIRMDLCMRRFTVNQLQRQIKKLNISITTLI